MAKADPAHEETDRILAAIEKRIAKEYKQAEREVQEKLDDYLRRFEAKDRTWQRWAKEGRKTEAEYRQWRTGQIAIGERWEELRQSLAEDYHNANRIARSVMEGYMPEVYAINHNYGTYEAERGARVDTSYTLYDRQTVERILRDNPKLLPDPGKDVRKKIAAGLDVRWNRQQIQSALMQSILQGEGIPKMAKRLAKEVGEKNHKAAIRNARTMATGAQNAGRVDSYKRAVEMGIEMQQEWRATLDMRTRYSHRQLDGQRVDVGEPFILDDEAMGHVEILYPGQLREDEETGFPQSMIWNCRCTLRGIVKGLEPQARKYRSTEDIGGMGYEEWKDGHAEKPHKVTDQEEKGAAIAASYVREYRR